MKTYNILYESEESIKKFLENNQNINDKELLIQIFTGIHEIKDINGFILVVKNYFPNAKIIGLTTNTALYNNKSVASNCIIAITSFEKTKVKINRVKFNNNSNEYNVGVYLGNSLDNCNIKAGIAFVDGMSVNCEEIAEGFYSVEHNIKLVGGISCNLENKESFIFDQYGVMQNGIIIATLENENMFVSTYVNMEWTPIGKMHTVTKSEGNIIKEIDDIPARIWYEKYIGEINVKSTFEIGFQFPLMLKRKNGYISKAIIGYTDNNELIIKPGTVINRGDEIRLGCGDFVEILNNNKMICKHLEDNPIEALFIYSCDARRIFMGELLDLENTPFLGVIELAGCSTFGEFGYDKSTNYRVFSFCNVYLAMSETKDNYINVNISKLDEFIQGTNAANIILNRVIKVSNKDINTYNELLEKKIDQQTEKLKQIFLKDELTGLDNKNKFNIDNNKYNYKKLALIDIKDFNNINNFYGNIVGDKVINSFSKYIQKYLKVYNLKLYKINSTIFAIPGDEAIKDYRFLYIIRELLGAINKKSFIVNDHEIYLNIIISIAFKEIDLLEKASLALEYIRNSKKNIQIYHSILNLEEEIKNNLKWIKKIKKAISDNRIIPYFQAIYNNRTEEFDKYEVLLRMIDEDGTIVEPMRFLSIAKRTNMYLSLQKIVINKAFEIFKDRSELEFSINLTVEDILDEETRKYLINKLKNCGFSQNVIFELVESEGIENFEDVKQFIDEVKKYNAKIAIDDFGSGYSNLSYLVKLKVDILKVDGSIIRHLANDEVSNVVTETILKLANHLKITTVAEYVENYSIYCKVKKLGIDYSQGYYLARPHPYLLKDNKI